MLVRYVRAIRSDDIGIVRVDCRSSRSKHRSDDPVACSICQMDGERLLWKLIDHARARFVSRLQLLHVLLVIGAQLRAFTYAGETIAKV